MNGTAINPFLPPRKTPTKKRFLGTEAGSSSSIEMTKTWMPASKVNQVESELNATNSKVDIRT